MTLESQTRSRAWYLLPIFFSILGGIIAYFLIREDDPKKAKNCLILGVILTVAPIIIGFMIFLYGTMSF